MPRSQRVALAQAELAVGHGVQETHSTRHIILQAGRSVGQPVAGPLPAQAPSCWTHAIAHIVAVSTQVCAAAQESAPESASVALDPASPGSAASPASCATRSSSPITNSHPSVMHDGAMASTRPSPPRMHAAIRLPKGPYAEQQPRRRASFHSEQSRAPASAIHASCVADRYEVRRVNDRKWAAEVATHDGTAGASHLHVLEANEAAEIEQMRRVGQTLREKWHLDALLGVGGMATVYAATHRNGAKCAVKILRPGEDEETKQRFQREGYIANRVEHAGAVRVFDDDVAEDGCPFLVMELLEGKSLYAYANELGGKVPPQQVMLVSYALLDVLAAAHETGIVHRDVKPENIFLTDDGSIKILDFGIARLVEENSVRRTQEGRTMGTPAFMSPEQSRGRWDLVGAESDLWSVGATMFTLLSGQFVHLGDTAQELVAASFTKPARKIREVKADVPDALAAVIDKALELPMSDRWATAREMQVAVQDAYREILGRPMPSLHLPPVVRMGKLSTSSSPAVETLGSPHPSRATSFPSLKATSSPVARPHQRSSYRRVGIVAVFAAMAFVLGTYRSSSSSSAVASSAGQKSDRWAATSAPQEAPKDVASSFPADAGPEPVTPVVRLPSATPVATKHIGVSPSARPDVYARRY